MGATPKNKWFIAIKKRGEDIFDISGLSIIEPPTGHYQADPFLIERDGITYLFHELYDYEKGKIAYSIVNDDLSITEPTVVIDDPTHMSFPCLFEENGEVYMTPESVLSGELRIYKATQFPDKWEKIKVVQTGRFDDPILFKKDGYYQIWCTEGENNLRIFRSRDLLGDWEASFRSDIKHSRCAGQVFDNGNLRPVQDCSEQYGRAIIIKVPGTNNIVHRIEPDWYPGLTGTHTFNFSDKYVVLDGRIPL